MKTNVLHSLKRDAAPGGKPPGKPKSKLKILVAVVLALGAPGQVIGQDLSGRWYHDGKPTNISVSGFNITITDEHGKSSSGHITGNDVVMPWLGIRGSVMDGGRRISWSNGTTWTRESRGHGSAADLNGRWFHDGKPTSISVSSNGRDVTITDEQGHRSSGYMSGNEIVIKSFYGFGGEIRGRVSRGGQRISWSNSTEWRR